MKALALFSGGLDSMLSMKIISDQGIEVVALYMDTGFGVDEEKHEVLRRRAALAGASLKVVDMRNEYLRDVLFNPNTATASSLTLVSTATDICLKPLLIC